MIIFRIKKYLIFILLVIVLFINSCSEPLIYKTIFINLRHSYSYSTADITSAKIYSISDGYITTLEPGDTTSYRTYVGDKIIAIEAFSKVSLYWLGRTSKLERKAIKSNQLSSIS
ncbi:MAG: hypothetical protein WA125_07600, partial [Desulfosporosinus sp.]